MGKRTLIYVVLLVLAAFPLAVQVLGEDGNTSVFDMITIDSAITPAVATYIVTAIDQSHTDGSAG
ncbi:MAG: hypothetical protein U9N38_04345, partial [Thermodesulfobacteriota bacterium]|nr:hypothetical protein [Thermodesulfobacteriota bacterium]